MDYLLKKLKCKLVQEWLSSQSPENVPIQLSFEYILCKLLERNLTKVKFTVDNKIELLRLCCAKFDEDAHRKISILFCYFENDVLASFVRQCHQILAEKSWFIDIISKFNAGMKYTEQDNPLLIMGCFMKESDAVISKTLREGTLVERIYFLKCCFSADYSFERWEEFMIWKLGGVQHMNIRDKTTRILHHWGERKSFEDECFWKKRWMSLFVECVNHEMWYIVSRMLDLSVVDNELISNCFDGGKNIPEENWLSRIVSHRRESNAWNVTSTSLKKVFSHIARDLFLYCNLRNVVKKPTNQSNNQSISQSINQRSKEIIESIRRVLTRLEEESAIPDPIRKEVKYEYLSKALRSSYMQILNIGQYWWNFRMMI